MPFLSIIIPCYNVEEYLPCTLDSLSHLKCDKDCEYIFVNDGSTDSTLSMLQAFAQDKKQAIVIDQPNQGVSAARNAALQIAKGEYILCLDGDDFLHPDTISIIKNHIKNADMMIAPCTIKQGDKPSTLQPIHIAEGVYNIEQLYQTCSVFPTAPQIIYKNSIIQNHQIYFDAQIKSGEVYTFTVDFFNHANSIAVCHEGFYNYVMRASSATHKPNYNADLTVLKILEHFARVQHPWKETISFQLTALKIVLSFTYNKYIRNRLSEDDALNVIETIFKDKNFTNILTSIPTNQLDFKHRLYMNFLKHMPIRLGYKICLRAAALLKQ